MVVLSFPFLNLTYDSVSVTDPSSYDHSYGDFSLGSGPPDKIESGTNTLEVTLRGINGDRGFEATYFMRNKTGM